MFFSFLNNDYMVYYDTMSNCDVALFVWNRISVACTQVFGDGTYVRFLL